MSTFSKSAQVRLIGVDGTLLERSKLRAWIIVLEDLARGVAELRHGLGACLVHADAMAIAAPREARGGIVHRHREERALERVVTDGATEIVPEQDHPPRGALHGDARDTEGHAPLQHLERG